MTKQPKSCTYNALSHQEDNSHGYNVTDETKKKYLTRLKRIEGQTRGIHRMIEEDTYCIDVITQISAVTSALENVALALMEDHISHCIARATDDPDIAAQKIDEAMVAIKRMFKN